VNGNLFIPVAVMVKKILLYESGKEDEVVQWITSLLWVICLLLWR
jgi:hypothetical protein